MKPDYSDMALDADGIPILTERVTGEVEPAQEAAAPVEVPTRTPAELASELLADDAIQEEIKRLASNLASDVRLRMEQTLAVAIDEAINTTMENQKQDAYEYIRRQLDTELPRLLGNALQDVDVKL